MSSLDDKLSQIVVDGGDEFHQTNLYDEVIEEIKQVFKEAAKSMIREYDNNKPEDERDFDDGWNNALWAYNDTIDGE